MSLDGYKVKSNVPESKKHSIRCVGGASAITKDGGGKGISVSRTGTGAYLLTWKDAPGAFIKWSANFGASTPANVAGHTAVRGVYDSSALTLAFVVYNSTFAAHDLAAAEYIDIEVEFSPTGVSG